MLAENAGKAFHNTLQEMYKQAEVTGIMKQQVPLYQDGFEQ